MAGTIDRAKPVCQGPTMPLSDYRIEPFTHDGITHDVYHRGEGRSVLVAAEIPGITPTVVAFADRLVDRGLSVALPSMFGTPGAPATTRRQVTTVLGACISSEFHCMALRDSSPATDWLRALGRDLHAVHGGPGIGFVGVCLTGGVGLAMMLDDAVVAPVLSQPALPFPLGSARKASTGLSESELARVAERAAAGCPVLGLRFTEARSSHPRRAEPGARLPLRTAGRVAVVRRRCGVSVRRRPRRPAPGTRGPSRDPWWHRRR